MKQDDLFTDSSPDTNSATAPRSTVSVAVSPQVDVDSLECGDTRTDGVEALALHAIDALGIVQHLRAANCNTVSVAAAVGQIVARMAAPGFERATQPLTAER